MKLHHDVVSPELYRLLQKLMRLPYLQQFSLVGGTSLALRLGHRVSDDIDLFTCETFDSQALAENLKKDFNMTGVETAENTVRGIVEGIKVDLIAHRYPQLKPVDEMDGLRLSSIEDVAAMKLNAIANRGSKKDFWDLAELFKFFSKEQLLWFCSEKYQGDSLWNVEKSLCYFDDAESDPDPRYLRGKTWEQVKTEILLQQRS